MPSTRVTRRRWPRLSLYRQVDSRGGECDPTLLVWQGPTATQDWYRDVLIEGKQHGAIGVSSIPTLTNNLRMPCALFMKTGIMTVIRQPGRLARRLEDKPAGA